MKGYKGFSKGLICREKQYAVGELFVEPTANICESGMHFCERPEDVLDYYGLIADNGDWNEFAEIEIPEDAVVKREDNKCCTDKLRITQRLTRREFINAIVSSISEQAEELAQWLDNGLGYRAQLSSSSDYAKIGSSGYAAKIGSSGYGAKIGSSGDAAQIGSSGYAARVSSEGQNSVICCAGAGSRARAKIGSWITLAEWNFDESGNPAPVCVKTERVDGERIREDVWYELCNGEFCEVNNEDGN